MISTFFAQFLNSAVVLVLVNLDLRKYFGLDWLGDGDVSGFSKDWYLVVGTPIFVTLLINSVTPHMILYAEKVVGRILLWKKSRSAKTQLQLNKVVMRSKKPFNLGERLAFVLVTVFITNMLSFVFPAMPWVAAFTLHLTYRYNKYNLLRYYVNTSHLKCFDSQMPMVASMILPMSAVLHCFCSIYLLSDPWLEPYSIDMHNDAGFIRRALLPNTFPLTILMLVFAFICTCINSSKFYEAVAPDCLQLSDYYQGDDEDNPTWTETKEEFAGRDGEVLSYHIGDNPEYATIVHGEPKYSPLSPERKDDSTASRRNSVGTTAMRKRTLLRVQSYLEQGLGEEDDHDNFHETSSQYRPSAPSLDLMDGSDHGDMMTPHGSLASSHGSDQLLDASAKSNGTAGSLMKRESSLHEDHHAISEIFLGEAASLLKDFHKERQKGKKEKAKEKEEEAKVALVADGVLQDKVDDENEGEGKSEEEGDVGK